MAQKFYYTYKITLLCGSLKDHYYLGQHQTVNLEDKYPGSGTKLRNYYRKYCVEEGKTYRKEILNFYSSKEELDQAEKVLIGNLYKTDPLCINLKEGGGGGGNASQMQTTEAHSKALATKKARYGTATGHMRTPEAKAKNRAVRESKYGSVTGMMNTPEVRAKSQHTLIEKYGSIAGAMHTSEARAKATEVKRAKYGTAMGKALDPEVVAKSRATRKKKYGNVAGALHTPEARAKSKRTLTERYGSVVGQMHTPEARAKAKASRIKKYGSDTGQMNTPEVKAAQHSKRLRQMSVTHSSEFLEWYDPKKYGHYAPRAVPDYLKHIGKSLSDFEEFSYEKAGMTLAEFNVKCRKLRKNITSTEQKTAA